MKKDGKKIVISVGDLASWIHRSGDLNHESSHYGRNRAAAGRKIHTWLQKKRCKQYPQEYQAEVSTSYVAVFDDLEVSIQGRIDGVRAKAAWLEEIKSLAAGYDDLEADKKALHWSQLYLYGYLYSQQQHLDEMILCLSYVQVESKALFAEERHVTYEELQQFFRQSIAEFVKWAKLIMEQKQKMLQTAALLEFPFGIFRPGQREMSAQVYQAIRHTEPLMVQAATGIGKTLATIFPSVKAMGKGYINRIVYLSARSIGQRVLKVCVSVI